MDMISISITTAMLFIMIIFWLESHSNKDYTKPITEGKEKLENEKLLEDMRKSIAYWVNLNSSRCDRIYELEKEVKDLNKLVCFPKYKVGEVVYFRSDDRVVFGVIVGLVEHIATDIEEGTLKNRRIHKFKYKIEVWEKNPTFQKNILLTVIPEKDITGRTGEEIK